MVPRSPPAAFILFISPFPIWGDHWEFCCHESGWSFPCVLNSSSCYRANIQYSLRVTHILVMRRSEQGTAYIKCPNVRNVVFGLWRHPGSCSAYEQYPRKFIYLLCRPDLIPQSVVIRVCVSFWQLTGRETLESWWIQNLEEWLCMPLCESLEGAVHSCLGMPSRGAEGCELHTLDVWNLLQDLKLLKSQGASKS